MLYVVILIIILVCECEVRSVDPDVRNTRKLYLWVENYEPQPPRATKVGLYIITATLLISQWNKDITYICSIAILKMSHTCTCYVIPVNNCAKNVFLLAKAEAFFTGTSAVPVAAGAMVLCLLIGTRVAFCDKVRQNSCTTD